jgi:hypothetical protein
MKGVPRGRYKQRIDAPAGYVDTKAYAGEQGVGVRSGMRSVSGAWDVEGDISWAYSRLQDNEIDTINSLIHTIREGTSKASISLQYGGEITKVTAYYLFPKRISIEKFLAAQKWGNGAKALGKKIWYVNLALTGYTIGSGWLSGKHPDEIATDLGGLEGWLYYRFKELGWIDPERRETIGHAFLKLAGGLL